MVFGTVAVADGHVAGVIGPRHLELVDRVAVDLVQRGEAAATFGVAVVRPVFLCVGRSHRGDAWAGTVRRHAWVRDEHIACRQSNARRQYGRHGIGAARRLIDEQRVDQRHHHTDGRKHEQSREQWPEHQAHIRHRPDGRADQERREQPGPGRFASGDQQPGNRHDRAADQEVPGTSQADQFDAANGQREAEQGDDNAQAQQ